MKYDREDLNLVGQMAATIAAGVVAGPRRLNGHDNFNPEIIAEWSVSCAVAILNETCERLNETCERLDATPESGGEGAETSKAESETVEEDLQPNKGESAK